MNRSSSILVVAALAASTGLAIAQNQTHQGHSADHSSHASVPPASDDPSTKAYAEANERMHRDMAVALTGDADLDFIQGMIPHHQGAVDMARIVLEYGTDPQVRELAEAVIETQAEEIALMKRWLSARGK